MTDCIITIIRALPFALWLWCGAQLVRILKEEYLSVRKLGKVEHTERGFEIIQFADYYGEPCNLQQSSLAHNTQPGSSAIWLGCSDANPRILASKAAEHGVQTTETTGWVPFPIPDAVLLNTRMHLDVETVKRLIVSLQNWVDTGSFKEGKS